MLAMFGISLSMTCQAWCQPISEEVSDLYTIVGNGGFEEGEDLPSFWRPFPPKPEEWGRHSRDTEVFHSGKSSGLLTSDAPSPPGKAGVQWNRYGIEVEGGVTLIVSYWIRTEGVVPIGTGCHFYDKDGAHLGFFPVRAPHETDDWTYVRGYVDVPPGAKKMGFALYGGKNGKTWFDDVALLGIPRTQATEASPVVDGSLTDACWSEDNAIKAFAKHPGDRLPAMPPSAWIAYDDASLYVAFRCPHPKGAELLCEATEHDGRTWLDDSIEVFVDPGRRRSDYYQLCVNYRGVLRDSLRTDTSWESGARAAVKQAEDAWTIELAIPYDSLGIDLGVGGSWGMNLVYNNRALGETSTWSLDGFHMPGRFGAVSLAPDLTRFYLPYLAAKLDQEERVATSLLEQIQAAGLPEDALAQPLKLLDDAKATIRRLRAMKSPSDVPEGGWAEVSRELAGVSETLASARVAAINAVFRTAEGPGEGGFRVGLTHSLHKVRRSGPVRDGLLVREVHLDAARDESESFQLVVIPAGADLKGVQVEPGPLTGPGGELPVVWHRVGYVETTKPSYATEYVGWWADPLLPAGPFDVKADERQPLWFTVNVPPDAKPGTYTGEVTIRHEGRSVAVPVELRVRSFRLPRPGTLATAFGMYLGALGKWWHDNPRDMPIEQYARWVEFLGKYRLTPKNVGREYITQTNVDGGFEIDLSALDKTVKPFAAKYFAPYSFCLHRLPTSGGIGKAATGKDPDLAARVVKAYADEWERQGLPSEVYVYGYDEPRPEHYPFMQQAYAKIKAVAPQYPIMQTISDPHPEELVGLVGIWCPLTPALTADFYRERVRAGDVLWTYVCCGPKPPYANFFVDEPATDHRVLFWQIRQAGATGLLYWCLCWWNGIPNAASGKPCFPDVPIHLKDHGPTKRYKANSDGFIAYPGKDYAPLSSIRLEVIRDGIEDYEYLARLSRLVARAKALPAERRPDDETLARAEGLCAVPESISRTMTAYTKNPARIFDRRKAVGDMIEQLAAALGPGTALP